MLETYNIEEHCRYCNYKFKDSDEKIHQCPLCCASRDRYSNLASGTQFTREEIKALCLAETYRMKPENIKSLFTPTGRNKIIQTNFKKLEQRTLSNE